MRYSTRKIQPQCFNNLETTASKSLILTGESFFCYLAGKRKVVPIAAHSWDNIPCKFPGYWQGFFQEGMGAFAPAPSLPHALHTNKCLTSNKPYNLVLHA